MKCKSLATFFFILNSILAKPISFQEMFNQYQNFDENKKHLSLLAGYALLRSSLLENIKTLQNADAKILTGGQHLLRMWLQSINTFKNYFFLLSPNLELHPHGLAQQLSIEVLAKIFHALLEFKEQIGSNEKKPYNDCKENFKRKIIYLLDEGLNKNHLEEVELGLKIDLLNKKIPLETDYTNILFDQKIKFTAHQKSLQNLHYHSELRKTYEQIADDLLYVFYLSEKIQWKRLKELPEMIFIAAIYLKCSHKNESQKFYSYFSKKFFRSSNVQKDQNKLLPFYLTFYKHSIDLTDFLSQSAYNQKINASPEILMSHFFRAVFYHPIKKNYSYAKKIKKISFHERELEQLEAFSVAFIEKHFYNQPFLKLFYQQHNGHKMSIFIPRLKTLVQALETILSIQKNYRSLEQKLKFICQRLSREDFKVQSIVKDADSIEVDFYINNVHMFSWREEKNQLFLILPSFEPLSEKKISDFNAVEYIAMLSQVDYWKKRESQNIPFYDIVFLPHKNFFLIDLLHHHIRINEDYQVQKTKDHLLQELLLNALPKPTVEHQEPKQDRLKKYVAEDIFWNDTVIAISQQKMDYIEATYQNSFQQYGAKKVLYEAMRQKKQTVVDFLLIPFLKDANRYISNPSELLSTYQEILEWIIQNSLHKTFFAFLDQIGSAFLLTKTSHGQLLEQAIHFNLIHEENLSEIGLYLPREALYHIDISLNRLSFLHHLVHLKSTQTHKKIIFQLLNYPWTKESLNSLEFKTLILESFESNALHLTYFLIKQYSLSDLIKKISTQKELLTAVVHSLCSEGSPEELNKLVEVFSMDILNLSDQNDMPAFIKAFQGENDRIIDFLNFLNFPETFFENPCYTDNKKKELLDLCETFSEISINPKMTEKKLLFNPQNPGIFYRATQANALPKKHSQHRLFNRFFRAKILF